MVAQRGTLNKVEQGVFMVLSLPVSAFAHIDDDGDGKMSGAEFDRHYVAISDAVAEGIQLTDDNGNKPLQGVLLSPVMEHGHGVEHDTVSKQLVVMGRFALENMKGDLHFVVNLFGKHAQEQKLTVTVSDAAIPSESQQMVLTPGWPAGKVLWPKP